MTSRPCQPHAPPPRGRRPVGRRGVRARSGAPAGERVPEGDRDRGQPGGRGQAARLRARAPSLEAAGAARRIRTSCRSTRIGSAASTCGKGYLGVDVRSRVERAGDAATVIYTVEEGVRARTRVVITGLPEDADLPRAKVRAELPLADGEPFDYAVFDEAKPRLLGVASRTPATPTRSSPPRSWRIARGHEAIVQLDYDLGPKCTFGAVELSGVEGDARRRGAGARAVLAGRAATRQRAIAATQRQLYGLARFSTVQVQPDGDRVAGGRRQDRRLRGARHEVRLGGGFGIDPTAYEVRGRAGYSIAGWPFPLDTVTLDLRPAYAYLRDGSGWRAADPRARPARAPGLPVDVRARARSRPATTTSPSRRTRATARARASGSRRRSGPSKLQLRLGWGIEQLGFRNISPLIVDGAADASSASTAANGSARTSRRWSSICATTRSSRGSAPTASCASSRARSTPAASFVRRSSSPSCAATCRSGRSVLAARARVGAFFGDVPVTERFFSGGASSQRGFGERRLSPFVTGDVDGQLTDRAVRRRRAGRDQLRGADPDHDVARHRHRHGGVPRRR